MSAPRLEIRLDRIGHNARTLVGRLRARGIAVCGVTKATLGSPEVARELLAAGVTSLGESRLENVEHLRRSGVTAPVVLVRSPMLSQADGVVALVDVSLNSEIDVIARLSGAACRQQRSHGVVVMVELGDLREGVMPGDLHDTVRRALELPGIVVRGIGTNLACQNGVIPDASNMAELSALATSIETTFGIALDIVSGGNSANLEWALNPATDIGRVNQLRLGESILLGREPTRRAAIDGLHTETVVIVGEVIESKDKPSRAWGTVGQAAFVALDAPIPEPPVPERQVAEARGARVIVALGRHDTDPDGLLAPDGYRILGASSDHLIMASPSPRPEVGTELRFGVNYSALMRAMASPFVARELTAGVAVVDRGVSGRGD